MINILIPALGGGNFFKDYFFPKLMLEIKGETVLERVISNFADIEDKQFIFVLPQKECSEFHLDSSVRLLCGTDNAYTIILKNQPQGALCTSLLTIDYINNDEPLIICNSDQVIDVDFNTVINDFMNRNLDAGVITFPSIHPRWSYVRTEVREDGGEYVIEAEEKRPISKHAVAGFYFFAHGRDFIEAAKKVILKNDSLNGIYYVSAALNELILANKKIGIFEISKTKYHSFYSPEKIFEYNEELNRHENCEA